MIKKVLLLLPLLLVSSCGEKDKVYFNVNYEYDREKICYYIEIPERFYQDVEKRNYTIPANNVHDVYVEQYYCAESCNRLALNEFHTAKKELIVYYLKK